MNRRSFLISTISSTVLAATAKGHGAEAPSEKDSQPSSNQLSSRLSTLHPRLANQGWGALLFDKNAKGGALQIGDRVARHGVSTHARSDLVYLVAGRYGRFRAWVGVDAANSKPDATARFLVYGDGSKLFESSMMKAATPAVPVDVDITGVNVLRLVVTYVGTPADHVDWAEAELIHDGHPTTVEPSVQAGTSRRIKSGDLTFIAGGGSLAGLELGDGKSIKLIGKFGTGAYSRTGLATVKIANAMSPVGQGLAWDWECSSHSHKPWTMPVETTFQWPGASPAKIWLPWGHGSQWEDPLVPQPFADKTYEYGAFFNREGGLSLPMATVIDEANGIGVSFIQSPRDVILDMQIATTANGGISFSRAFHRFGGESEKLKFHMDIVVHEPDVRTALNAMVQRYPEYFEPNPYADEVGGGGAYSGWEGALDTKKLSAMSFSMNWKASIDFPYMGVFLPPVKDDEKWNRFAGGGEGDFSPKDEGRYGQTSVHEMAVYSTDMRANGFHVLNYFNVTEFGTYITYPAPPAKSEDAPDLWKSANALLHGKLESAVLKSPDPIWTWGKGVIMDCGDPAYRDLLLDQARRHVQKLPDSSGICIDRMDWLTRYNPNADDEVTWIDGMCRHLRRSWISLMEELGPIFHDAGKVIFANDMDRRLELMRHVDGFYDEHGYFPFNLNTSSFLALRKPLVCWTSDENSFGADQETYFQQFLYMGAFPTVPYPANDHSVMPSDANDQIYLDYGPLFNALKGRKWLLKPGVIQVDGVAKANVFETKAAYVVFVGLAGKQTSARLTLRGLPTAASVRHPGEATAMPLTAEAKGESVVFDVPLKRGCAMLVLEKVAT